MSRHRDEQEMRNGLDVAHWLVHLTAHPEVVIDLNLICHFNRLILKATDRDFWAGRLRAEVNWQEPDEWSRPRAIVSPVDPGLAVADIESGVLITKFPPDAKVKPLLDTLIAWQQSSASLEVDPILRAAIFHHEFVRIHPFRDGNGRTARALASLILFREDFRFELFILQQYLDERRNAYIAALRSADQGDLTAWLTFFTQTLADAIEQSAKLE